MTSTQANLLKQLSYFKRNWRHARTNTCKRQKNDQKNNVKILKNEAIKEKGLYSRDCLLSLSHGCEYIEIDHSVDTTPKHTHTKGKGGKLVSSCALSSHAFRLLNMILFSSFREMLKYLWNMCTEQHTSTSTSMKISYSQKLEKTHQWCIFQEYSQMTSNDTAWQRNEYKKSIHQLTLF